MKLIAEQRDQSVRISHIAVYTNLQPTPITKSFALHLKQLDSAISSTETNILEENVFNDFSISFTTLNESSAVTELYQKIKAETGSALSHVRQQFSTIL